MSFLKEVKLPEGASTTGKGGFLSSVTLPQNQQRADDTAYFQQQATLAQKESEQLNKPLTVLKNTVKGIPNSVKNNSFFAQLANNISEGAKNISRGSIKDLFGFNTGLPGTTMGAGGEIGKGINKVAFRTASDVAIKIFEPLSIAVGFALQKAGGQKLIDSVGNVVADKNGITDIPAFQKFVMEHPNAGLDFERLLTLATLGPETGKIEPKRLKTEVDTVVNKIFKDSENTKLTTEVPVAQLDTAPAVRGGFLDSVKLPTEGENVSRTSLKIQEQAKKLGIEADFSSVPKIESMSMLDEGAQARDLIARDLAEAKRVIADTTNDGVRREAVFRELSKKALDEGDAALVLELAKSKIGTEAAQALKALDTGYRLDADPVKALQEISTLRQEKALKGQDIKKVIKEEKAKLKPVEKVPPATWTEFIDELTC